MKKLIHRYRFKIGYFFFELKDPEIYYTEHGFGYRFTYARIEKLFFWFIMFCLYGLLFIYITKTI